MSTNDNPRALRQSNNDRGHSSGTQAGALSPSPCTSGASLPLRGLSLSARRTAKLRAITAREMRRRLKATGGRDVDDRHRGLQQQLAGAAQARLQVIAFGHAVEVALE